MKQSLVALAVFAALIISACSKNNNPLPNPGGGESDTLRGEIKASRTLKTGKTYYISGATLVKNSAVLTIEPGVVIKGIKGTKAVLIITRGSKIMAEGTAAKPIVFTSNQAAGARNYADWGGVVLLGKAKVNTSIDGVANRRLLEGFSPDEVASLKDDIVGGGDDDNDNSGVLKYVRIEFAGIALSSTNNSELNSLTFVGVGKGTVVDYIQCSYGGDDSFEWFGGTVNAKHLIAFRGLDDDFDTDNGYTGRVQFGISIRDKDLSDFNNSSGASNGFESDNDGNGTDNAPFTAPVFSNMTFVGPWAINGGANIPTNNVFRRGAHIRLNSRLSMYNSVIAGFPTGILIDGDKSALATAAELDIRNTFVGVATANKLEVKLVAGTLNLKSWFMTADRVNDTTYNTVDQYKFAKVSGLAATYADIDVRPVAGSPLIGKGAFIAGKSTDAFFTKVTYAGALDVADTWINTWTSFDPKNAAY
jgi:hypothetical protein